MHRLLCLLLSTLLWIPTLQAQPSPAEQLATLDDQAARALLLQKLNQEALEPGRSGDISLLHQQTERFNLRLQELERALEQLPEQRREFAARFAEAGGWPDFLWTLALALCAGLVAERLLGARLATLGHSIGDSSSPHWGNRLLLLALSSLLDLIRIGLFVMGAALVLILSKAPSDLHRQLLLGALAALVLVRLVACISHALLAPYAQGIRPLPLDCHQARSLYRGLLTFAIGYVLLHYSAAVLLKLDWPPILIRSQTILIAGVLQLFVLGLLWYQRPLLRQLFQDERLSHERLQQLLSQTWPWLVSAWLLGLYFLWSWNLFLGEHERAAHIGSSWWLTLSFPLVDRLVHRGLHALVTLELFQSPRFHERRARFVQTIQVGVRILLLGSAALALGDALGYEASAMARSQMGAELVDALVDIMITLLLAYVLWTLAQSQIEKRLPEPLDVDANLDGEGGGSGASRAETLLPLLRSCLLALLVATVILSILSALGVQIAPLLAGAGVVGIAIGFGAQKLVQDVISGIFFLMDDAFRRGEYIEVGNLRGTVEKISVRSMQLRHHLGAVQTIPYGNVPTITNLSRDWITMKLELRLPYDVDIERVRKIIKKVGQSMQEDPELGPNMLQPLKSQGVMRMEESALIIRMKFTARPGEQWVIRREAYRRVQEALQAAGIQFAHREVRVRLPEEIEQQLHPQRPEALESASQESTPALALAAAAAAVSALSAEEQKRAQLQKMDEDQESADDR